jgi:hypothetical protein
LAEDHAVSPRLCDAGGGIHTAWRDRYALPSSVPTRRAVADRHQVDVAVAYLVEEFFHEGFPLLAVRRVLLPTARIVIVRLLILLPTA